MSASKMSSKKQNEIKLEHNKRKVNIEIVETEQHGAQ
jgi:hypothetical protein